MIAGDKLFADISTAFLEDADSQIDQLRGRLLGRERASYLRALQQFMEGNVWWGINTGDPGTTLLGALVFIFFTWFMWPFWVPLSSYVLEPSGSRRRPYILAMTLAGLAFGLALYVRHLTNPEWVQVTVNQDSLVYEGTKILDYLMPRDMTYVIFLLLIIVPSLITTYLHMRWFALTIVVVVFVDILFLR
uniref:hypothetical protein n=1 Tax=Pararhizobium sp. IMCC3301 TaxID=3067904 RepID=UPI002740F60E|nr:hypothetical protein [Pararhizobium sp. IMCC3301]